MYENWRREMDKLLLDAGYVEKKHDNEMFN